MRLSQQKNLPQFLGLREAARYCNVSYRTLKAALDSGKIPYAKFGPQTYRISLEQLNLFMNGLSNANKSQ